MSIIGEVLIELEKRGVKPASGDASLRVVPRPAPRISLRHAVIGAAAMLALGGAYYLGYMKSGISGRAVAQVKPQLQPMLPRAQVASEPAIASELLAASAVTVEHETVPAQVKDKHESTKRRKVTTQGGGGHNVTAVRTHPKIVRDAEVSSASAQPVPALDADEGQQFKTITPQQRAEGEYRKASQALIEGKTDVALAGYQTALAQDPARKDISAAWASVLISLKRDNEAENVLHDALAGHPHDTELTMLLARSQVERGDLARAVDTLQQTLPYAEGQAGYQAFLAAVLQRMGRHQESLAYFQSALKLAPGNGIWLMGMGISLQALQRVPEAREAYQRALASNTLSAQLQGYVQNKLQELPLNAPAAASAPASTR